MSSLHDSKVGDFTRGGQVLIHFLRMIGQVLHKFGGALLVLYGVITVAVWFAQTDPYARELGYRYLGAAIGMSLDHGANPLVVERADGVPVRTTVRAFYESPAMVANANGLLRQAFLSVIQSAAGGGVVLVVFLLWLFRFGAAQRREQHVRGSRILPAANLKKLLVRGRRASAITVAGVPLIVDSETSHLLLTGSPGTGKTTSLYDLLATIRRRGDRCICYSAAGDFIEWFYRAEHDHLLNPFDARCPSWHLWAECRELFHYDMFAASLIPEPGGNADPFWNNAARTLVACLAQQMHAKGNHSITEFIRLLTRTDLPDLRA